MEGQNTCRIHTEFPVRVAELVQDIYFPLNILVLLLSALDVIELLDSSRASRAHSISISTLIRRKFPNS